MAMAGTGVAGYVLAGGASRRMGRDKALLGASEPLLVRMLALAGRVASPVVAVAPEGRYAGLGVTVLADRWPGEGPVGGVLTALESTRHTLNLVLAVDLPLAQEELLRQLIATAAEAGVSAIAGTAEFPEPLCAVYHINALEPLREFFHQGGRRFRDAVGGIPARFVPVTGPSLTNVNTPEQWEAVRF